MKGSHIAISAAVAALCAGILVLFTDVEVSMVRWFSCGPFSTQGEEQSEVWCLKRLELCPKAEREARRPSA